MILKIDNSVHEINLEGSLPFASPDTRGYLSLGAGIDQYKLLGSLSTQLEAGSKVGDLGTFYGNSSIALALNTTLNILTCDPTDCLRGENIGYRLLPNITYHQCKAFDLLPQLLDAKLILVDIGLHTGPLEAEVYDYLLAHQYKGLLLFDDIHLEKGLEILWDGIPKRKFDLTSIGHWSGSGLVVFDPSTIDVEVKL